MNCSDYRDWLSAFIDEALDPAQRAALEAHLQTCAHCHREQEALKAMVQSLRTLPSPQAPDLLPGIHKRLKPEPWWQSFTAPWPVSLPWHGLALATTALLVVLVSRPRSFDVASRPLMLAKEKKEAAAAAGNERAMFEPAYSRTAGEKFKLSDEESVARKPAEVEFNKRLRLAAAAPAREFRSGERSPASVIAPAPEKQLGASVELASAGGLVGYLDADKDAGKVYARAKDDYRLASLPRGNLRQSAFPESASVLNVERQIVDQLINGLAQGSLTQKSAAKGAYQSRADTAAFGAEQYLAQPAASSTAGLLQLRLLVTQVDEAVAQITTWANAHDGFVTLTTPNHLSVMLPASEVDAFLHAFSSEVLAQPDISDPASWITLSLELVPSQ